MIIGIEAQRIFRDRKHGMDFVALEMIRNLQIIDHENEYVIFVNDGPDQCLEETKNFKIVKFSGPYPLWEQFKLPRAVKKYGCDILHCTSNTAPVFCSVPLIITIHDIIYFETNPLTAPGYSPYQRFGNLYRRLVVRQNLKKVKQVITVSHFERKRFEEALSLDHEQLKVVYNGVGTHFSYESNAELEKTIRAKYNLPEKYLLFLGNTDPKKNTANTVKAFAEFNAVNKEGYKLVVADLDPKVIRKILLEVNHEEAFKHIQFTGYIDNGDLPVVINQAKVFLYPSMRESFGIPILEAMAAGAAVITSNRASMPEVAGDAALLVDPTNVQEIAQAISTLCEDEALNNAYVAKGRKRAEDFSWKKTAEEVLVLYKGLKN